MELFGLRKMSESNEGRSRAMEDLLKRFSSNDGEKSEHGNPNDDSEEIELNLGLSLGGRFGIDKNCKKLIRSTSVAGTLPVGREEDGMAVRHVCYPNLVRASSLPTETEEEWRKRKEMQTLRRMEAKRRRSEKQRNSKSEKDGGGCGDREIEGPIGSNLVPVFGLPSWAVAGRQIVIGGGGGDAAGKGFLQPCSQGSMESQGGSSSGISELESRPVQGSSNCSEARSPSSIQSLHERRNQDAAGSSGTKANENACQTSRPEMENTSNKPTSAKNKGREVGINAMEDMPCVFTKGNGPNGRRVDGILYKYGKGEEVRIMCICHGSFLSPTEFVKHAGGGDVAHPLKHIVVNPCPNSFL